MESVPFESSLATVFVINYNKSTLTDTESFDYTIASRFKVVTWTYEGFTVQFITKLLDSKIYFKVLGSDINGLIGGKLVDILGES